MVIHTFGAYYGLAISWMLYRPNLEQSSRLQGSVYHSDVFAMIGGGHIGFMLIYSTVYLQTYYTEYLNIKSTIYTTVQRFGVTQTIPMKIPFSHFPL